MVAKEIPRSYDHIFYHAFLSGRVLLFFAFAEQPHSSVVLFSVLFSSAGCIV